ncbi:minor capsid protein [Acinetobacter baumannii]|nr:hypothetical protein [Acinetobacter baumannii]
MNLLPLATELQTKKIGTMGKTVFINMLPIDVPLGVLLRNSLSGTEIDYELPGYFRTEFQVIVRAGSYPAGEALMDKVFNTLTLNDRQLGNMHFNYIRPRTEPVVFPLSDGNLLEFSAYFDVSFYKVK